MSGIVSSLTPDSSTRHLSLLSPQTSSETDLNLTRPRSHTSSLQATPHIRSDWILQPRVLRVVYSKNGPFGGEWVSAAHPSGDREIFRSVDQQRPSDAADYSLLETGTDHHSVRFCRCCTVRRYLTLEHRTLVGFEFHVQRREGIQPEVNGESQYARNHDGLPGLVPAYYTTL